jgi:hypothetical protein
VDAAPPERGEKAGKIGQRAILGHHIKNRPAHDCQRYKNRQNKKAVPRRIARHIESPL